DELNELPEPQAEGQGHLDRLATPVAYRDDDRNDDEEDYSAHLPLQPMACAAALQPPGALSLGSLSGFRTTSAHSSWITRSAGSRSAATAWRTVSASRLAGPNGVS